jgi:DNA-binding XRE family transcriptional regulator
LPLRKPSIAAILRAEIRRVARREMKRAMTRVRRLQRRVSLMRLEGRRQQRLLDRLQRRLKRVGAARGGAPAGRGSAPDAIRALRARLGMTRKQFSQALGVSPGAIFLWETGRSVPRRSSLARLKELRARGPKAGTGRAKSPARRRPRRAA